MWTAAVACVVTAPVVMAQSLDPTFQQTAMVGVHRSNRSADAVWFRFTGGEIVGEFLMSLGYLPGAHRDDCPVQARIRALNPPWTRE